MTVHFRVAEKSSGSYWHLALLRWSMVAIFIWFGIQKFTPYAAEAIAPLIEHSPSTSVSGTEVEPLGFDQSLKLGSGHRLITEGHRFKSCPHVAPQTLRAHAQDVGYLR